MQGERGSTDCSDRPPAQRAAAEYERADSVTATANFAVWRFQYEATDVYVGRYVYVLVRCPAGLMVQERRVILDLETLRPHGKLSFIL